MANKTPKNTANDNKIGLMDRLSKQILQSIDTNYQEREILVGRDAEIQSIIRDELNFSRGISQGNVVDLISSFKNDNGHVLSSGSSSTPGGGTLTAAQRDDLFTRDIGDIFGYFQDTFKNRYLEIADLKFISKFIPAIGEAVKTTLDSVVTSDDLSATITRLLVYPTNMSSEEQNLCTDLIETIETKYGLQKKLKNVIYKRSLITGSFYVYEIAYKELFEKYSDLKKNNQLDDFFKNNGRIKAPKALVNRNQKKNNTGFHIAKESAYEISIATEAATTNDGTMIDNGGIVHGRKELKEQLKEAKFTAPELTAAMTAISSSIGTISVHNDPTCVYDALYEAYAMEQMQASTGQDLSSYQDFFGTINTEVTTDGTADMDTAKKEQTRSDKFEVKGSYIKYIDAKNILPLKVYNQLIGYYHVHATPRGGKAGKSKGGISTSVSGIGSTLFSSENFTKQKQEAAVNAIVNTISDGIINNFSSRFVADNPTFRDLISDCLIANGLINNDYQIQFIPADYIIPFIVNEDENGEGESILADSLFSAKMLLSLVVSKMLNYMNNASSTTIAHVRKGPIDVATTNQAQRVIRNLTESNINFNDLVSSNMVFSKFSRNNRIQLPTSKDGAHLVDFETQDGQNINMDTEFENWLERNAIMGTGVPSVIMDYVNSADFAKSLTTANIKFAGRISSLQSDFEEPTTRLYMRLVEHSGMHPEVVKRLMSGFKFKLARPKVLSNSNMNEFIGSILSTANSIADVRFAPMGDSPLLEKTKSTFILEYLKANAPFFDWSAIEDLVDKARLTVVEDEDVKSDTASNEGDMIDDDFADDI